MSDTKLLITLRLGHTRRCSDVLLVKSRNNTTISRRVVHKLSWHTRRVISNADELLSVSALMLCSARAIMATKRLFLLDDDHGGGALSLLDGRLWHCILMYISFISLIDRFDEF